MTPQHSTLRISALYLARGMISHREYREFRSEFLGAVIDSGELPELPDAWHHVAPGTHIADEDEIPAMPSISSKRSLSPRIMAVALVVLGIAIGGLIALLKHV